MRDNVIFSNLKNIKFENLRVDEKHIKRVEGALNIITHLELRCFYSHGGVFAQFASYCQNLTSLCMKACEHGYRVFDEYYPNLEYLHYGPFSKFTDEEDELEEFLNRHKNLKHFECEWIFLHFNARAFENTTAKINEITTNFSLDYQGGGLTFESFLILLKKIHARGVFKWLNVSFDYFFCIHISDSWSLDNELIALNNTIPIKKLHLLEFHRISSHNYALKLTNLEHVYIRSPVAYMLEPFFLYAKKLKSLRLGQMRCREGLDGEIRGFDLSEFDNLRQKENLNARTIFVYMCERDYFAAKSLSTNSNLSSIKLKRSI